MLSDANAFAISYYQECYIPNSGMLTIVYFKIRAQNQRRSENWL